MVVVDAKCLIVPPTELTLTANLLIHGLVLLTGQSVLPFEPPIGLTLSTALLQAIMAVLVLTKRLER